MDKPVAWKMWLRLFTRGSPLYLLSAACILYGLSQIIVPLYANLDEPKAEKFYCLGAINLYEIALLAVALIVISYKHIMDDAISLVTLIGAFLVGSAAALNTVAPAEPVWATCIGLLGMVLAVGKLGLLDRHVIGRLGGWPLVVISVLVVWNFLAPAVLGWCVNNQMTGPAHQQVWAGAWCVVLSAGALLVLGVMRLPTGRLAQHGQPRSWLGSELARWLFAGLILTASFLHAWGQTWAFWMHIRAGDLLPVVGVLAMLAIGLRHALGRKRNHYDAVIAVVPIVLAALVLVTRNHTFGVNAGLGLISYPPVFAAVIGVALVAAAWHLRRPGLLSPAVTGLVLASATFRVPAGAAPDLNWPAAVVMLGVAMVVLAIVFRSQYWALGAAAVVAFGATFAGPTRTWTEENGLASLALLLVIVGLLFQVVHYLFRSKQSRYAAVAGTLMLAVGVMHCFVRPGSGVYHPFIAGVAVLAVGAALFGVVRDWLIAVPTVAPVGLAVGQATPGSGWNWVILSFMLLAAGAVVSVWKERWFSLLQVETHANGEDLPRLIEQDTVDDKPPGEPPGAEDVTDRPPGQ